MRGERTFEATGNCLSTMMISAWLLPVCAYHTVNRDRSVSIKTAAFISNRYKIKGSISYPNPAFWLVGTLLVFMFLWAYTNSMWPTVIGEFPLEDCYQSMIQEFWFSKMYKRASYFPSRRRLLLWKTDHERPVLQHEVMLKHYLSIPCSREPCQGQFQPEGFQSRGYYHHLGFWDIYCMHAFVTRMEGWRSP